MMAGVKVPDGPAVGDDMALKLPLSSKRIAQQCFAPAAGLTVGTVVGAHDSLYLGILYQIFKSGKIGFLQIFWGGDGIELMAERFRAAVHGEMLGTGGAFQMLSMPLQTVYISLPHAGCQIRVFPVGLMAAAPAGIPKNVDVGGPEAQTVINVPVSLFCKLVELCPAFGGGGVAELFDQRVVKHGSQTNGLWETGGGAAAGNAMKGFVPPVVSRDPETLNGGGVKTQLAGLLTQSHLRNKSRCFFSCLFSCHVFLLLSMVQKEAASFGIVSLFAASLNS